MGKARDKLASGDFNTMYVEALPSGFQKVTLVKDGEKKVYKMVVKDLYLPSEELTDEEEVDID